MKEALIVAAFAFLVCLGLLIAEERDHAETKRLHAEQIADLERAGREAVEEARIEEQRRYTALQEIAHETQTQLDRARADAAGAANAGDRLRKRIAQLTASCRAGTGHPGSAAPGQTADVTADLLADVQQRLDEAADAIARHADAARIAGLACESAYDAVSAQ
ncbi:DUF2514 family protein [Parazoarcus communis]|uniref:DUF2514 family protein n=1 Tax=Parazoarcus communis TaxID=41977 RepID=UPI001403132A|nr:DUF2514 family protein [Parazoarcus communis]NMG71837.1 DUF2514 family protein [Parazoarcus communis SWub3 = DSM 12120]